MTPPRLLVVGRLRKPHGLKGEMSVFPLSDDPAAALAAGRTLRVMNLEGAVADEPVVIERSRGYHREWLVKFRGRNDRESVEALRERFLAAPADELAPLEQDEVYLHELAGFAVRSETDEALGVVSDVYEMPAGLMLEVQGPRREFLLPYRREFVREVDREGRRLVVMLPEGLLDLPG